MAWVFLSFIMQTLTLNNGVTMPLLGLGTYSLTGKAGQKAMSEAIEVGYRLFDSAQMYHNEAELGMAINNAIKGGIKREEFFIQTKLLDANSEDSTKKSMRDTFINAAKTLDGGNARQNIATKLESFYCGEKCRGRLYFRESHA